MTVPVPAGSGGRSVALPTRRREPGLRRRGRDDFVVDEAPLVQGLLINGDDAKRHDCFSPMSVTPGWHDAGAAWNYQHGEPAPRRPPMPLGRS